MDRTLRIGILGAGFMGQTHGRAYRRLAGVEVVGVSSRRIEKARHLAEEIGAQPIVEPDALIGDSSVDAIDICLPTSEHARYAIAALQAGKHVIVEKPLALTLDDAKAILDAHRRSGRTLMVAHVLRFWPEYVAIAEIVRRGDLGRPFAVQAWRLQAPPLWSDLFAEPSRTGGAVLDLMIHDYDVLNWLCGRPSSVFAHGVRGRHGGWDHVQATLTYPDAVGATEGSLMMSGTFPFSMGLRVVGERGAIEYVFRAGGRGVETGSDESSALTWFPNEGEPSRIAVEPADAYASEIAYFVECLRTGVEPERGAPSDAFLALEVALAVTRSLERRSVETL